MSCEELDGVAQAMGLPEIRPEWLGANLALRGIEAMTWVPLVSRLIFESKRPV